MTSNTYDAIPFKSMTYKTNIKSYAPYFALVDHTSLAGLSSRSYRTPITHTTVFFKNRDSYKPRQKRVTITSKDVSHIIGRLLRNLCSTVEVHI